MTFATAWLLMFMNLYLKKTCATPTLEIKMKDSAQMINVVLF